MANTFTYQDQTFSVGDQVKVHLKIKEDTKTRTQIFEGMIISIKGSETGKSFTVRKIGSYNIGVERILPVMSPNISQIELVSKGHVRRSKLYYLRNRVGRRALRVKESKTITNGQKVVTKRQASRTTSQAKTA